MIPEKWRKFSSSQTKLIDCKNTNKTYQIPGLYALEIALTPQSIPIILHNERIYKVVDYKVRGNIVVLKVNSSYSGEFIGEYHLFSADVNDICHNFLAKGKAS